jgi:transcriptional regulator with XRE-family HTH domain
MIARNVLSLLLEINGLSRRQLAALTGIPRSYINEIALGRRLPTNQELLSICHALKTTPEMIYPNADVRKLLMEV